MARGIDTVIVFRVLKLITTPWKEQAAFEHGLIDEKGKRTKKKPSTSKEKDAYKVKITEGEKVSYRYYSVDSGLLLSVEEQDDNNNIVSTNYSDYRDVNGIKFPFNTEIPSQKLELNMTEILINKELKDSDF